MSCSVVIIARNEEKNIAAAIESCQSFACEFIVVDDHSTDNTASIAKALGAKVFTRALNGDWGAQQTFGMQQATQPWLFLLDCDECCTPELAQEIQAIVQQKPTQAYWVKRLNHFKKRRVKYGPLSPDWVLRLLPKEGSYVDGYVHPKIVVQVPQTRLKHALLHYTYESWAQLEGKMAKYSTLAAKKYFDEGKQSAYAKDLILRPAVAFFKMYVLKRGFLDGALGWALAKNYANYTLAKYYKLYELNEQRRSSS